jgi:hypothetical protein
MSALVSYLFRKWIVGVPLVAGILMFIPVAFLHKSTVSADGMQYFVSQNHLNGCSDSYPGTIDQPWCTITKANAELNPGDTVFIREGIYEETIRPANSGSEGAYITYTSYQNENVYIKHVSTGVNLDNRSYIHINGIHIEGTQVLADCCAEETIDQPCYDMMSWVRMENSNYNILSNNEMMYASAWSGIRMRGVTHHNKILNNKIIGGHGPADVVDCADHCSDNLIEGNVIHYGTHVSVALNTDAQSQSGNDRNIIRNNVIWNPWHSCIGVIANSDYTLVENNLIMDCGEDYQNNCRGQSRDTDRGRLNHSGIQISSSYVIIRNNTIVNAGGGIPAGSGFYSKRSVYKYCKDIRVYNNTLYENYRGIHSNSPPPSWVVGNTFMNNILAGSREYDVWSFIRSDPEEPNPERFYFNNILSSGTPVCYGDNSGLSCFDSLAQAESALPQVFWNNIDSAPLFVDSAGRDFHLLGESPAIDSGAFLTRTVNAGTGTQIQVEDVWYFTDGYGVIDGDRIQLESQLEVASILNIDYENRILILDRPMSWVAGQGVSLAYKGNAPDIGAFEYDLGEPTPTFVDVPLDHWAYDYIENLYQDGYVAGCNPDPLMYCPDATMTRAESAVFVERGIHGADYLPDQPTEQIFADVPLTEWFAKWATALWNDGYTAGCDTDPLIYCPLHGHTRAEGSVFFLRMMHGVDYVPPEPTGIFADAPITVWYAKWVEAAYAAGIIPACQTEPELLFCPEEALDRAMAAFMMVQSKGLDIP